MLLIDFEQAFVIHNAYQQSERELFKLSLQILVAPPVIAGALLSAGLISSPAQLQVILELPIIWMALIVAGLINSIVVRAYVATDRVQTEAKHQVNRLRALYLHALADRFPEGWRPVWGSTNPYLETRFKFKAAAFTPLVLSATNAAYVSYGLDQLLAHGRILPLHAVVAASAGLLYFLVQLEVTWNAVRWLNRNIRRGPNDGKQ